MKNKNTTGRTPAKYAALFKQGKIGEVKIKNRLVMPPMVRNYADLEGRVTDRYIAHIERVASGGVGTMIIEASYIRPDGKGFRNQLGIYDDTAISGLSKLVEAAHRHGAAIGIQLYHGGRQSSKAVSGFQPVAPSAIADPVVGEKPRALTVKDIGELVQAFGEASERAKKAGFDFVELHAAHGYLINQFLSPFSNTRTDGYGNDADGRRRFLMETLEEIKRRVGGSFPITVRLSADELVEGGLRVRDTVTTARILEKAGVAALHVSAGVYASFAQGRMIPPMAIPDGVLLPLAAKVKTAVKIPVIAVGKLRTPEIGAKALREGQADFIAIGRSLLADPEWPNKVQSGRAQDVLTCVACNQGCISRLFEQKDVLCTVNAMTGHELKFAQRPARALRIWIIGGGPAGLTAAIVAAERGHKVTLFEKEKKLGGQLEAAAAAPYRESWNSYREWLINRVHTLGVKVELGKEFDPEKARKTEPDAIIVAIGSSSQRPNIPGVDLPHVVMSRDLLAGRVKMKKGRTVLAGGGCMGAQTAEFLAEKGHKVTIVEMSGNIATESPTDDRALLIDRLTKKKVVTMIEMRVGEITPTHVRVVGKDGTKNDLPADNVVLCLGSTANDITASDVEGIARSTIVVGDALDPRRVTEAVREAAEAVLQVERS